MRRAVPGLCTFIVVALHAQAPALQYAWVEMVANGAEVRAIVPAGTACPSARIDGKSLQLNLRADPAISVAGFPATCQATLTAHPHRITLEGKPLPVPNAKVKRILVIGDTGCRVTEGEMQNCTTDWPFGSIASFAAAKKPDLVIHVGDYYYREVCPKGEKHCENFTNWRLDFFDPARPLFAAAPWVFARGNHETCARASQGWFRYLDVASAPLPCPGAKEQTFLVILKGVTLAVIDSADLPDAWTADKKLESFKADIESAHATPGNPLWIVTHKPPFVQGYMNPNSDGKAEEHDPSITNLQMILAGHLHLFGSFNFGEDRPSQLIVGDSGTRLMVAASQLDKKLSIADPNAMLEKKAKIDGKEADFTVKGRFGYFMLERDSASSKKWRGTLYGTSDNAIATCQISGRELHCDSAPSR